MKQHDSSTTTASGAVRPGEQGRGAPALPEYGTWEYDLVTNSFSYDGDMLELFGLRPQDVATGLDGLAGPAGAWLGAIHPDDVIEGTVYVDHLRADPGSRVDVDVRVRRGDGVARYIRVRCGMALDAAGQPRALVGSCSDVTRYRHEVNEQRRAKERLELATRGAEVGVFEYDVATDRFLWDSQMYALYGREQGDFSGMLSEWTGLLHPEDGPTVTADWLDAFGEQSTFEAEFRVPLPDGSIRYLRVLVQLFRDDGGRPERALGLSWDVTERRAIAERLVHAATHDSLTNLPNRAAFKERLREARDDAIASGREHVLCFLDVDRFKVINDSVGHAAGDDLLREFGHLLESHRRPQDFLGRIGGDEFALVLTDCSLPEAEEIGRSLLAATNQLRFVWDGAVHHVSTSIGLTAVVSTSPAPPQLMTEADVACYTAKREGRNRHAVYTPEQGVARRHHLEIHQAARVRSAIEEGRFVLHGQEIHAIGPVTEATRQIEVLVRMVEPDGRLVLPSAFIPAAERYDLMGEIDRLVIRALVDQFGPVLAADQALTVAVNLSANSLTDPDLWPFIAASIGDAGLPTARFQFEITETALINNLSTAAQLVASLRAAGCSVTLDDFGSGLSSFGYLKQFPVDELKIDGSFIQQLTTSTRDRLIVEAMNDIGHKLGAKTVAEFVEDTETLAILSEIGVDRAQGFVFGPVVPLVELLAPVASDLG